MNRNNIIEEIQEKDLVNFQKIMKEAFNSKANYEQIKNFYDVSTSNKDVILLGYYINDIIVGTLTLNILTLPSTKDATIWNFAVLEEYRRLGIGRKLMNKSEEIAKENGVDGQIWLFSGNQRTNAHKLYRSLGYDENMDKAFVKKV